MSENLEFPENIYILVMHAHPIFPGLFTPLEIHDPENINLIEHAIKTKGYIGLCMTKDQNKSSNDIDNIYKVGTFAQIMKKINLPEGGISIFVSTKKRFTVNDFLHLDSEPHLTANVTYLKNKEEDEKELQAYARQVRYEIKQLGVSSWVNEDIKLNLANIDSPSNLSDFIASNLQLNRNQQQELLETLSVKKRLEILLVAIKEEQFIYDIQLNLKNKVNRKIDKSQREYFLKEELKQIKKELKLDNEPNEYFDLAEKLKKLNLEGEVKEAAKVQFSRLQMLDPSNAEYTIIRNYLDLIINLPWKKSTKDSIDLAKAKKILNQDHYGLKDVKERILELLAVRKRKKDQKGAIICLVGPPGVGKTSIGKSIATAIGKKYYRFSVGGMRDEAEIKGHRRTYVGALPGKIIQGLEICKSNNPLFLIDEIDKMGESYNGDPASALLEVLDPEQNVAFRDRYLDLPFDLSNILFVLTANTLDPIPRPLLDRMEIIHLSGYTSEEKMIIGQNYLLPKSLEKHGLTKKSISISEKTLMVIAENYAREAGVRRFEQLLWKLCRKVAYDLETKEDLKQPVLIDESKLIGYLGQKVFNDDSKIEATEVGCSIGLAWTNYGGDALLIETKALLGNKNIILTGQLGDVMKESATIAFTYIKSICLNRGISPSFFDEHEVHLHVPEGATPKDGPSAGITIATAIYSLVTNQKIKKNLAMTGELSLTGKVMPIGGLKEKLLAAKRNDITTVVIPKENASLLDDIDETIKKDLDIKLVSTFEEVRSIAFEDDKFKELNEEEYNKQVVQRERDHRLKTLENEAKIIKLAIQAIKEINND